MNLVFDLNKLTVGDLEDLEELTGMQYEAINWAKPGAKLLKAMAFIAGRWENPEFTLDDARNIRIVELKPADENPTVDGDAS